MRGHEDREVVGADRGLWEASWTRRTLVFTLSKTELQEASEQETDVISLKCSQDPSGCM